MPSNIRRRAEIPLRDEISKDIKFNAWVKRASMIGSPRGSGSHLHVRSGRDFSLLVADYRRFTAYGRRRRDARYTGIIVKFSNNYCNCTGTGAIYRGIVGPDLERCVSPRHRSRLAWLKPRSPETGVSFVRKIDLLGSRDASPQTTALQELPSGEHRQSNHEVSRSFQQRKSKSHLRGHPETLAE